LQATSTTIAEVPYAERKGFVVPGTDQGANSCALSANDLLTGSRVRCVDSPTRRRHFLLRPNQEKHFDRTPRSRTIGSSFHAQGFARAASSSSFQAAV